jgi:hypothetical protein
MVGYLTVFPNAMGGQGNMSCVLRRVKRNVSKAIITQGYKECFRYTSEEFHTREHAQKVFLSIVAKQKT